MPGRGAPGRGSTQNRPTSALPEDTTVGGRLPRGFLPLALVCTAVIAAGVVLQAAMPDGFPLVKDRNASPRAVQMITEIHSHGPLRINEIMTSNSGVMTDASGNAPDWLEVANIGNSPVNLKGYVLARNSKAGNVFVFPEGVLQPGECAVVFADGHLQQDAGEELHAPFRLSAMGDVLMLFNQADVAVDTVNIPPLAQNEVYARTGAETWEVTTSATPGMLNTEENYRAMTTVSGDSPVKIVELMSSNDSYAPDENGVCHDYVTLRNDSGESVDLGGWFLSDTQQLPRMWRFPEGVTLPPGGTITLHCSGLNRMEDPAHLHTSFRLSSEGEQVILSDSSGRPRDMVSFDLVKTDTAWIRGGDGSWSAGAPTAEKAANAS